MLISPRIWKCAVFFILYIAFQTKIYAEIIYHDVNTTLAPAQFVALDIDGDGDNELQILNNISQVNIFTPTIAPVGASNIQLLTHSFATSNADQLSAGEIVGDANAEAFKDGVPNGCIGSCLAQHFVVWPSSVNDVYIAFRFTDNGTGEQHYGWLNIDIVFSGTTILEFTIKGIAYESTPSSNIMTGFIPVSSISVQGLNDVSEIIIDAGTLQIQVTVLPVSATNTNVIWSVDAPSLANIDTAGLLTAKSNGTVIVYAAAVDGSGVSGSTSIIINNQTVNLPLDGIYKGINFAN